MKHERKNYDPHASRHDSFIFHTCENVDIDTIRVERSRNMQAQASMQKGELLYELHAKNVSTTIKDIGPNGIQLEMNDRGEFSGKLHGNHIDTVTVNQKTDGTNEWQLKSIMNTKDGDMVVVWGSGKGRMSGPTTGNWEGELHFMTQSPKLSWLNNSTGWAEGQGNMATGESHGKIYAKK